MPVGWHLAGCWLAGCWVLSGLAGWLLAGWACGALHNQMGHFATRSATLQLEALKRTSARQGAAFKSNCDGIKIVLVSRAVSACPTLCRESRWKKAFAALLLPCCS